MVTILNVDDNGASRYARSQVLRQAGYHVLEATGGEQALKMVMEERPQLVLLDVNLPDISGLDVCRRVKGNPHTAAIPVLHISATAVEEQDLITGLQAADAYVTEPVQPNMLLALVGALLRGSELLRQWVAVFDALTDGVALINAEGSILRCNSAFCRLLGKRVGEVLGRPIMDAISGTQCARDELPFPRSLGTGHSQSVECGFAGKVYRFSSHLALVRGNVAGAIYIITDVTGEKRASQEKDEALALLRGLTDDAPVGFAFFDCDVRYRLVNRHLAKKNGLPAEAHIGRTPEEVVPWRAAEFRRVFQSVVETGLPVIDHEYVMEDPGGAGETRSWSESWYPVKSADGRLIGVGVTALETTEKKRAEKEQQILERRMLDAQKLESIGLLAGGIAHDFNNLLTGILGNAGLALEIADSQSAVASCLEEIVKAGERAAHLTKQMLAYSGKGQFFVESLDLSEEAQDVVRLVRASISKKISVDLDLGKDLPRMRADKGQLQQVVMNIVVNAAEAIGDANGLLSVRTGIRELSSREIRETLAGAELEPGCYIFLEVTDTGCGMNEETEARIFDPFFTTKFTGRGLGLAAVGGIVRSHKGAIQVRSAPGQGSTFTVYFPPVAQEAPVSAAKAETSRSSKIQVCGSILVVDDEEMVRHTARGALERLGCQVMVAGSGPEAIELFRRHAGEVSLIILDLSMAGMSGLDVLPELRRVRSDVSVLISSGYSESETLRLFAGHQISGFLQKPYTPQRLLERVEYAMVRSQASTPHS
jgi:two-component system cell cycle sensor histidine kinase/response regulator CckA